MKKQGHLLLSFLLMIFLMIIAFSCKYYNEEDLTPAPPPCDTTNVTYTNTILPIFNANCIVCHSTAIGSGGIILDTYTDAKVPAQNGMLWNAVSWAPGFPFQMPKDGAQLPSCDLAKIKKWIDSGVPQ